MTDARKAADRPVQRVFRLEEPADTQLAWLCEHMADDLGRPRSAVDVVRIALRELYKSELKKFVRKSPDRD